MLEQLNPNLLNNISTQICNISKQNSKAGCPLLMDHMAAPFILFFFDNAIPYTSSQCGVLSS